MMQDRKWLPSNDGNDKSLHLGPFIPTKWGIVLIAVLSQLYNVLCVSMQKPQPDLLQILLQDHCQRST
jgi:hypothetical protein